MERMKGRVGTVLGLAMALSLALGCAAQTTSPSKAQANPLEPKLKAQDAALQDLQNKLKTKEAELADATTKLKAEKTRADGLDAEVKRLQKELAAKSKTDTVDLDKLKAEFGDDANVQLVDGGVAVSMLGEILFDSGSDKLNARGIAALKRAAGVIRSKFPNSTITVEGHTDNVPIKKSSFKSNWELSSARALTVMHYLVDNEHFKPERLSVAAFADTRPVAPNTTEAGRRQNRRSVLVIRTR